MELTKEQILQIDNYISTCGIKYYDVKAEIVDHFANILEQKLDENPTLDFKKEIQNIHRNFSDKGFQKLLKEKTNAVQKKFYKMSAKHFLTFFKLPKMILTGMLFYLLYTVMNLFDDKEVFFQILTGLGFLFILLGFFSLFIEKKQKKEIFLALNMNTSFFQIITNFVILFNTITVFRSSESLTNPFYNGVQLAIYVLAILFLFSAYHIYQQNKKQVKELYPNVLV